MTANPYMPSSPADPVEPGAFAVPVDVGWDTGFGAEDLTPGPVRRPAGSTRAPASPAADPPAADPPPAGGVPRGPAAADPAAPRRVRRRVAWAGGRWRVKVFRVLVYTLLGVLVLGGLRNLLAPRRVPDVATLAAQVAAQLGQTGFPTAAAEGFTVQFAAAYLTYSPETAAARAAALARYAPGAARGDYGPDGQGRQRVLAGPVVAAPTQVQDANNATVTVAAQVDGGGWVYLAVPVYASPAGGLVVAGPPAYVPAPPTATAPPSSRAGGGDDALATLLAGQVLPGYLQAWARSDAAAVARYTTPDATLAARVGLGGAVTLDQVARVWMPRDGGDRRTGGVDVVWRAGAAGILTQSYRVTVARAGDGRWYVQDLRGGRSAAGG